MFPAIGWSMSTILTALTSPAPLLVIEMGLFSTALPGEQNFIRAIPVARTRATTVHS